MRKHHREKLCETKVENFGVKVGELIIFQDVNFTLNCGELTALIGPNGAGKSTLLKSILGEVSHMGKLNYFDAKGKHLRPIIGYVPQTLKFDATSPTSVLDLFMACLTWRPVWLFSAKSIRERVLKNLQRVQAEYLIDRRLGALSGGELQRVLLALALDPLPDLLLLDEPVSGVDEIGLKIFRRLKLSARILNRYTITTPLPVTNKKKPVLILHGDKDFNEIIFWRSSKKVKCCKKILHGK